MTFLAVLLGTVNNYVIIICVSILCIYSIYFVCGIFYSDEVDVGQLILNMLQEHVKINIQLYKLF